MALTTAGGKSLTAFSGAAKKAGLAAKIGAGGKGALKALGLTNPWTAALIGIGIGLDFLLSELLAPDPPERPLRYSVLRDRVNPARWPLGEKIRIAGQMVWGSVIYGPGSRGQASDSTQFKYYDNHARFIYVICESGAHGIEGLTHSLSGRGTRAEMWADGERITLTKKSGTTNEWTGGQLVNGLSAPGAPGGVTAFPQANVFRIREYLSGDGVVPAAIQVSAADQSKYVTTAEYGSYNHNPPSGGGRGIEYDDSVGEWLTAAQFAAKTAAQQADLIRVAERETGPQFADGHGNPIKISQTEWPWTANHKLAGKAYFVVDIISPFNQGDDPEDDRFRRVPRLEFLISGLKFTWPGQAVARSSSNAVAQMYWYDTVRMGVPAASIDTARFAAAYAIAERTVTVSEGDIPANLADLKAIKSYKFGESSHVIQSGESPKAVYARLRAKIAGWRYPWRGKVVYRAGADEAARLALDADDFVDAVECAPAPDIRSRFTRLTLTIPQSERNGFEQETLVYDAGAAAVAKAGRARNLDVQLDCATNALDAGHKAAILYRQSRQSFTFNAIVRRQPGAANLGLAPLDAVTVTLPELGLQARKCIVLANEFGPDFESYMTLRLDEGGVYAETLTLPPALDRRLEFRRVKPGPEVTGLAGSGYAVKQADGTVVNHLVATWDAADSSALVTECECREGSPWGGGAAAPAPAPSAATGVLYAVRGLRPFTVGAAGSGADATAASNRWGVWLQYVGGLGGMGVPYNQMAGQGILGTGAPLKTFRRFGAYAADAGTVLGGPGAGKTLLWLTALGSTSGSTPYDFTPAQERDWRIALRRQAGGQVYIMQAPQPSQDPDNPYLWDAGTGLRDFLLAARAAGDKVDAMVVDLSAEGMDLAALRRGAGAWQPMPAAERRAEIPGAREGRLYDLRARHVTAGSGPGRWAAAAYRLAGDLTPPGVPRDKALTPTDGGFKATWVNAADPDIAYTQVGYKQELVHSAADPIVILADAPGQLYETGPVVSSSTANVDVWLRHVDRRGNVGAWDAKGTVRPHLFAVAPGPATLTGAADPPAWDLGKVGDLYIASSLRLYRRERTGSATATGWAYQFSLARLGSAGWAIVRATLTEAQTPALGENGLPEALSTGTAVVALNGNWWEYTGGTSFAYRGNLRGPAGAKGEPGPAGIGGEPGRQGDPGPQGERGDPGIKGEPGRQGDPGPQGERGDQGITGEPGRQGGPGPAGATGAAGTKGEKGVPGVQGEQGPDGPAGSPGDKGPKGSLGPVGAVGQKGVHGDSQFIYYTNAPASTDPATLAPVTRLSDGRWTTSSGYYWYGDATQVPAD